MAAVDLVKGPVEAFGPFEANLESISTIRTKYQVFFFALFEVLP